VVGQHLPDGADIEGIIVRVDNAAVLRWPADAMVPAMISRAQTGPYDDTTGGDYKASAGLN
jgi:hypothetical protein